MDLREVSKLLYTIKLIDQKISGQFEKKIGFSLTRYALLIALTDHEPLLQTELQEHLKIDNAAVTRHLKILEEKGYVNRQRNPKNNREVLVTLTEKAKSELNSCLTNYSDSQTILYPFFTEEEIQQLSGLLNKLNDNL